MVRLVGRYFLIGFFDPYLRSIRKGLRTLPVLETMPEPAKVRPDEDAAQVLAAQDYFSAATWSFRHRKNLAPGFPSRKFPTDDCLRFGDSAHYMGVVLLVPWRWRRGAEQFGTPERKDKFPLASSRFLALPAVFFLGQGEGRWVGREELDRYVEERRESAWSEEPVSPERSKTASSASAAVVARFSGDRQVGQPACIRPVSLARARGRGLRSLRELRGAHPHGYRIASRGGPKISDRPEQVRGMGYLRGHPPDAFRLVGWEKEPSLATDAELCRRVARQNEAAHQKRPLA